MNDATDTKSISKQITRVFALGATALLFFYAAVFNLSFYIPKTPLTKEG